ncbi:hypothetical protein [Kitasatospora sp. NBC_01539]
MGIRRFEVEGAVEAGAGLGGAQFDGSAAAVLEGFDEGVVTARP